MLCPRKTQAALRQAYQNPLSAKGGPFRTHWLESNPNCRAMVEVKVFWFKFFGPRPSGKKAGNKGKFLKGP